MTLAEYQEKAHTFALLQRGSKEALIYALMGLSEEAGEVVGKVAKFIRKNASIPIGTEETLRDVVKPELGDVCWFLAECCTILGLSLEEVMESNIAKLEDRWKRGVIIGEGDKR